MKRCPICECGAELLNPFGYYGAQTGATAIGIAGGLLVGLFSPRWGGPTANKIRMDMIKDVHKKYRCTNKKCLHEWQE